MSDEKGSGLAVSLDVTTKGRTVHGDPVVTIQLTGIHDALRFADRMLEWQCEFGAAGRRILRDLRRAVGAKEFDAYCRYLGADRVIPYAKPLRRAL